MAKRNKLREVPKPRNWVAASLSAFKSATVRAKRGRGSYKRKERGNSLSF